MGGEITWVCDGSGDYIFTLKIHRDCSGPAVNTSGQKIDVWGHNTVTQIPVNHIQTNEVSPSCREVPGGPSAISCVTNQVAGAAEEYVFTSAPITLAGVPPANGWVFTWDNVTRNSTITNLVSPNTKGMTLRAVMYNNGGQNGSPCYDSSPQFIESPSSIICAGSSFTYSPNAYDPDFDSLVFSFGQPLDAIQSSYNPPSDPASLNFVTGYSINSPLPGTSQNSNNVPATINPSTGEINFTCFTQGSFALVLKVQSYRCGVLIAEVYREMQVIIINCPSNNAPTVIPPLGNNTSFDTTVKAGDLVTFTFSASDNDLMQDNSPQNVEISATGVQFGANFTDATTGCDQPPCATLSPASPVNAPTSASTTFSWQTSCAHLNNNVLSSCGKPTSKYQFVFRVKDDFCPAPAVRYYQVSITLENDKTVDAPIPLCADISPNGDVYLTWNQISDDDNVFDSYIIYGDDGTGVVALDTITSINTTQYTHTGANIQSNTWEYRIGARSDCGLTATSIPIKPIKLIVNNPGNGEAVLQWNKLFTPVDGALSTGNYTIYRRYPSGGWQAITTVPYGAENYRDTVTVCEDSVEYRVEAAATSGCVSNSTIAIDLFRDLMAPPPPSIQNISIDSATGIATVCWYPSTSGDVQGYIILRQIGTTWQPIDTVYAKDSLCYTDGSNANAGDFSPVCYGIAAFDSCWRGNPMTPNTSAMGVSHCSVHLSYTYDVCDQSVKLDWTGYTDWNSGVGQYIVYLTQGGQTGVVGAVGGNVTTYTIDQVPSNVTYCLFVRAVSSGGSDTAQSNRICFPTYYPKVSDTNYLSAVSVVNDEEVDIKIYTEPSAANTGFIIERSLNGVTYTSIGQTGYTPPVTTFTDKDLDDIDLKNHYYRAIPIDSCGTPSDSLTNIGKTMVLQVTSDGGSFINNLNWGNYQRWDGGVGSYEVWRKLGDQNYTAVATVPFGTNNYQDDVSSFYNQDTKGNFCYKIRAVENTNRYGFAEESFSNESCASIPYILFVPNAFTPEGMNPIFKPEIGFANFESYSLRIFNRLHKEIFTSEDVNDGWDGTYKGKEVPTGIYVYLIQFRDSKGQPQEISGHLNLLR